VGLGSEVEIDAFSKQSPGRRPPMDPRLTYLTGPLTEPHDHDGTRYLGDRRQISCPLRTVVRHRLLSYLTRSETIEILAWRN